jgi:hypothetical protein
MKCSSERLRADVENIWFPEIPETHAGIIEWMSRFELGGSFAKFHVGQPSEYGVLPQCNRVYQHLQLVDQSSRSAGA